MKTSISLLFILISLQLFAQKNAIKLNLPSLFFKNIYVSYERAIDENKSITIDASVLIPKKIPSYLLDISNEDVSNEKFDLNELKSIRLNGFQITPAFRFYLQKKKTLHGFYTELYARYRRYYVDHDFLINNQYESNISINWSKIGIGGAIGSQWKIKDHFVIDIMWLGFDVDYHSFSFGGSTTHPEANYTTDNEYINKALPIIAKLFSLETNSTTKSFSTTTGTVLVGFRFKLAIGYVF